MLSVGEILKKERERKGISLAEVEKKIRVRQKFLAAVEANDWSKFSSKIYIGGVIKNYSIFLGLDPDKTAAFFRRDYARKEIVKFKRKLASKYLTPETKRLVKVSLVLLFVIFFTYFAYQLKLYFSPPNIKIISPKSLVLKNIDRIKIVGQTEKDAAVSIFGERVYQNKNGVFEYMLPVRKGKNELVIEVIGANGKKNILKREIIVQ